MRLLLGTILALTLLLTGCGGDGADDRADDPTPTEPEVVALVSESNVGGEVSPVAVSLDSPTLIADFAAQFEDERMGAAISAALADAQLAEGQSVVGAVVAIGCEPPTEATVESGADGVEITAAPVKTDKQCLVPVTTVALVTVPATS